MKTAIHSSYLKSVMTPALFARTIRNTVKAIRKNFPTAQAIAFRGASGSLVAMSLCSRLNMFPMMIRKPDGNHCGYKIEGAIDIDRYIIVDDLISSGATVDAIINTINEYAMGERKCLGIVCYTWGTEYSGWHGYADLKCPVIGVEPRMGNRRTY